MIFRAEVPWGQLRQAGLPVRVFGILKVPLCQMVCGNDTETDM